MRVAIIGAGPGGLLTLKYLLEAKQKFNIESIEAKIFEAQDAVGGTFRYRSYPEAEVMFFRFLEMQSTQLLWTGLI